MPKSGNQSKNATSLSPVPLEQSIHRIANLLALLLVKGESETDKVLTLVSVGYTPAEIAQLLGKQANTVSVILYQKKRAHRKSKH